MNATVKVSTASLFASPTNPRKRFDPKKLEELEASIRKNGILQPLLVRESVEKPGTYEVVDGERRRRVLEKLAELEAPVFIRELTDDEVKIAQMVSFLQKDDLHPLDEADAYRELLETVPVNEVAARVGRPESHVALRLTLCKLSKEARAAYLEGKINHGVALVVARIADPKKRDEALERFLAFHKANGESISTKAASEFVLHNVMLRLKGAPFDVKDAALVPDAGACIACDKRTGANPTLFEDLQSKDDLCNDAACFQGKTAAAWLSKATAARASQRQVIEKPAEVKQHFPHDGQTLQSRTYQSLDEVVEADKKKRTIRQILGNNVASAVIKHPTTGAAVELVKKSELPKLLKAEGVKVPEVAALGSKSTSSGATPAKKKADPKETVKRMLDARVQREALAAVIVELVTRTEQHKNPVEVLRFVVALALDATYIPESLIERRKWSRTKKTSELVRGLTAPQLIGVVLEQELANGLSITDEQVVTACKILGVDAKKITDGVRKKLEADVPKPAAAPAAKPSASKKPAPKAKASKPAKKKGVR